VTVREREMSKKGERTRGGCRLSIQRPTPTAQTPMGPHARLTTQDGRCGRFRTRRLLSPTPSMPASPRAQVLGVLGLLSVVARGGAQDSLPGAVARLVSRSHHPIRDAFHNDPLVQPVPLVDGLKVISMPSCGLGNRLRQINGAVNFAKTIGARLEIHVRS